MRKIILLTLLMFAFSSSYSQKAFVGSIVGKLKGAQWDHKIQDGTVIVTFKINELAYQEYVKKNIDQVADQFSPLVSVVAPWGLMQDGKSYQSVYKVVSGAIGIFYFSDSQLVQFMWHLADFPGSQSEDFLRNSESTIDATTTSTTPVAPASILPTIQTSGDYEYSPLISLDKSRSSSYKSSSKTLPSRLISMCVHLD